jgi:hypothetical protein
MHDQLSTWKRVRHCLQGAKACRSLWGHSHSWRDFDVDDLSNTRVAHRDGEAAINVERHGNTCLALGKRSGSRWTPAAGAARLAHAHVAQCTLAGRCALLVDQILWCRRLTGFATDAFSDTLVAFIALLTAAVRFPIKVAPGCATCWRCPFDHQERREDQQRVEACTAPPHRCGRGGHLPPRPAGCLDERARASRRRPGPPVVV